MKKEEDDFTGCKSRSQRKREADQLDELAGFLVEMGASQLKALPVDDELKSEIRHIQRLESLPARRRQTKYLAKLLRNQDIDELSAHVARIRQSKVRQVENFHRIEMWRERLCDEGVGVVDELEQHLSGIDLEPLRNVVRQFQETGGRREYRLVFDMVRKAMGEKG